MRLNHKQGAAAEDAALAFLLAKGCSLLARNWHCAYGEIDLIVKNGGTIVFVEVKYRSSGGNGVAAAAVDIHKQKRISRAASFFLIRYGYQEPPCRFDVVAIDGQQIQWIRNAFDYCK